MNHKCNMACIFIVGITISSPPPFSLHLTADLPAFVTITNFNPWVEIEVKCKNELSVVSIVAGVLAVIVVVAELETSLAITQSPNAYYLSNCKACALEVPSQCVGWIAELSLDGIGMLWGVINRFERLPLELILIWFEQIQWWWKWIKN